MTLAIPAIVCTALLIATLVAQARWSSRRLVIVTAGAASACLVTSIGGVASTRDLLSGVPWDVLIMLVSLGLLTELLVESRLFGVLALASTRRSRAEPTRILILFGAGMYLVSGLVNNLTAIMFVLPILLSLFKLLGVTQRYATWTLGVLLVASNLGGAATPIGDFPAVLLLGSGHMEFADYLIAAAPATAAALVLLLLIVLVIVRPARDLGDSELQRRVSLTVIGSLYRRARLDRRIFIPAAIAMTAMVVAWLVVPPHLVGPELICWIGVGAALGAVPQVGERLLRSRVEVEGALFLLALFVMVGAVSRSGVFATLSGALIALPVEPRVQLLLFLIIAGFVTGLFSAGPSMAALLEVAEALAARLPPTAVYVGLALSVCAGSSLFLTAATSGPMTQIMTEKAAIADRGGVRIVFGFFQFVPIGILAFAIILTVACAYALVAASLA